MKIKETNTTYVFEADDGAAKELIARGDYEEATKTDEKAAAPVVTPKRKGKAK